jgi:hypothetical protein
MQSLAITKETEGCQLIIRDAAFACNNPHQQAVKYRDA